MKNSFTQLKLSLGNSFSTVRVNKAKVGVTCLENKAKCISKTVTFILNIVLYCILILIVRHNKGLGSEEKYRNA